ncbi:DUF6240 domain-containing protein [Tepidibacter aestuarii]|uniref:DUF6240 domain-containing protein n=1 Tax=Tepidibacter aestuarii TaxID=2925782 RepID=UPI0020BED48D|nr:DUF6240 domain-containing protein [Tepidibacter aestuarii]CAH2211911.1 conserved protein of unknown function [Tepidibacter aestuarii]
MINNVSAEAAYSAASDAYNNLNTTSKVRGTVVEISGDDVTLDVGDKKLLNLKVKENINAKAGDAVVIDKKNIVESKKTDDIRNQKITENDKIEYSDILKRLDMDVNDENLEAVKTLKNHDISITKENIMSFVYSKKSLDDIIVNLDYDSAVKIMDKGVDIENDSLQKIADTIKEVKSEKEYFSFLKLFKNKKELTMDEAEKITEKLYGSKMGKDITDIVKTLHKKNVKITKRNIEKVNDIFYKLDKLQDAEEDTFIDTVKNNISPTIDNLYNIKNFVKSGAIKVADKISSISVKAYESFLPKLTKVTQKELDLLQEDIKESLDRMQVSITDNNIKLSEKMIKNELELTKENIQSINEMKEALAYVIKNLNKENLASMIKEDIDIEKMDIRDIENKLKDIGNIHITSDIEVKEVSDIIEKLQNLKELDETDLVKLIKKDVDFNLSKLNKVISNSNIDTEIINTTVQSISKITEVFNDVKNLDLNAISFNLRNSIPMTLNNVYKSHKSINKQVIKLEKNSENIVKKHVKDNISLFKTQDNDTKTVDLNKAFEVAKSLVQNKLSLSKSNIQKVYSAYNQYEYIKDNLTSNMVKESIKQNNPIDNMNLKEAGDYIKEFSNADRANIKIDKYIEQVTDNIRNINREKNNCIAFNIKNNKDMTLKEVQSTSDFLKNKNQLGHKISNFLDKIKNTDESYEKEDTQLKNYADKIEGTIKKYSENIKKGDFKPRKAYEDISEDIKKFREDIDLTKDYNKDIDEKHKEVKESLERSYTSNKDEKFIQYPLVINDHFSNLNMYYKNRKNSSKNIDKDDMDVAISLDTKNLGNINIHLGVNKAKVKVKIGLDDKNNIEYIKGNKDILNSFLEEIEYDLEDVEFEFDKDNIIGLNEEQEIESNIKGFLDIKI